MEELRKQMEELRKQTPPMDELIAEIQAEMDLVARLDDGDPLRQARLFAKMRALLQEEGQDVGKLPPFYTVEDVKSFIAHLMEKARLMKRIELFNQKYADFFGDDFSHEKMAEYVRDCRWMLPTIEQIYGADSDFAKRIATVAGLKLEGEG